MKYEVLSVGDVDGLGVGDAAFAFAAGVSVEREDGSVGVLGRDWWEDWVVDGVPGGMDRSRVAFGVDAKRVSVDGGSLVYEASDSQYGLGPVGDTVLVRASRGGESRVFPVHVRVVDHAPVCDGGVFDVLDRLGDDGVGMVTDGFGGSGVGGKVVVERGSRFSVDGGSCFDVDEDLVSQGVSSVGGVVRVGGRDGVDGRRVFVGVSGGVVGDGGSLVFSGVDDGGRESRAVVPVVVRDVPFVCGTVKGRIVVDVSAGGSVDVPLSCGLKYGVSPLGEVSVSGGVSEERSLSVFVPRVDEGSGVVSLRVSVNEGVVGKVTRTLALKNGGLVTRVPVDVVVGDPSQGGGEGSSSGSSGSGSSSSGGKYGSPMDTPGPKPVPSPPSSGGKKGSE